VNYVQLPTSIDLNDPDRGFQFATEDDQVKLWFTNWRNRRVVLRFRTVHWFSYRRTDALHGLPEGEALEILDSEGARSVWADGIASPGETVRHYVISTNEGLLLTRPHDPVEASGARWRLPRTKARLPRRMRLPGRSKS
jgi:hypothetical protein